MVFTLFVTLMCILMGICLGVSVDYAIECGEQEAEYKAAREDLGLE